MSYVIETSANGVDHVVPVGLSGERRACATCGGDHSDWGHERVHWEQPVSAELAAANTGPIPLPKPYADASTIRGRVLAVASMLVGLVPAGLLVLAAATL